MHRVLVLWVCAVLLLAGCGSGGGGGGAPSVSAPTAVPTIDMAVFEEDLLASGIRIYRDVLRLPSTGALPEVVVAPPPNVVSMAFAGTHLLVAQDLAMPALDRFFIYAPSDLAAVVPTPSVVVLIQPPAGMTSAHVRGFEVWDDDVYVHSTYDDGNWPVTISFVTHVFRDLATLANGATPDATITQDQFTTSALSSDISSIAVNDDVLLATGRGSVYVTLDPASVVGNLGPDRTLAQGTDLGIYASGEVILGGGEAYFFRLPYIAAFDDPAGLVAGRAPRFELMGPSSVVPVPGAIVRVGSRLFSQGPILTAPVPIVGFDVGGAVLDYAPPDVRLGPLSDLQQRLAGAADVLVSGDEAGIVGVYTDASTLADGDEPTIYLWDPDSKPVQMVGAVER